MLGFIFTYIKHITREYLGDHKEHKDLLSAKFLKLLSFRYIRGLFKKYPVWNFSGCSLGGMCLQPVLTCSYMS